jgi:hypothetical protein
MSQIKIWVRLRGSGFDWGKNSYPATSQVGCSERSAWPDDTLSGGELDGGCCCWDDERYGLAEWFSIEALRVVRLRVPGPPLDDARAVSSTGFVVTFLFLPQSLDRRLAVEDQS